MLPRINTLPSSLTLLVYLWIASNVVNGLVSPSADVVSLATRTSLSMNLARRSRTQLSLDELFAWAKEKKEALEYKYNGVGPANKRSVGVSQLTNLKLDVAYLGSVAIGTPPSVFYVSLDTGSADLWIATSTDDQIKRPDFPAFVPSESSTFQDLDEPFEVNYLRGGVAGVLGRDIVKFAGFEVPDQRFGAVNRIATNLLYPMAGFMGLGFQTLSVSHSVPFWQTIANSPGVLDEPVMGFHLTRFNNNSKAQPLEFGGTFTLGALNTTLFSGAIDYQNSPDGSSGWWMLAIAGVTSQGLPVSIPPENGAWAAIDTGTTGIGGPASSITSLYSNVPRSRRLTGEAKGYWEYPCDTTMNVTIRFGSSSTSWPMSPSDFNLQETRDGFCLGSFFEVTISGRGPSWVVGDSFLKNVYTSFRAEPRSVGFATLSSTAHAMSNPDFALPIVTPSPNVQSKPGSDDTASGVRRSVGVRLAVSLCSCLIGASILIL